MKRRNNGKILPVLSAVLLMGLVYAAGVWYFSDRFLPNSYVDGERVSFKTVAEVEEIVGGKADNYSIAIKTIDGRDQVIHASDMQMSFEVNDIVKEMKLSQGSAAWLLSPFKKFEYHAVPDIRINEDSLKSAFYSLPIFSKSMAVQPQDAKIELENDKFVVIKEIEGNVIKKKAALEALKNHVLNNDDEMNLEAEGFYKKPKIYSDHESISKPMEVLAKYNSSAVRYDIEGADEVVDPSVFSSWISIDKDSYEVGINENAVKEYVQALARRHDTWSLSREFKPTGLPKMSIKGGSYGWLIERGAEAKQLMEDIKSGESITREPIYRYKAKAKVPNDIGDTYVEIDITRQRMWFYKDGQLVVETPVVTGRPTPSRYTPLGIYPLNYKTKDATLTGEGYSSPVKLWMPFNNNVGIHDASWRSSFGGQIYKTSGSHGCINTPYSAVLKIYEKIEKGDPIIVYASGPYEIKEPEKEKPEEEKPEDANDNESGADTDADRADGHTDEGDDEE